MTTHFADRLIHSVRKYGPLCVGLDPHPQYLPDIFGVPGPGAIALWAEALIDQLRGKVAVVKLQMALFECWGAAGIAVLEHVCRSARDAGLIVILDAKRGDIGVTAQAYARTYITDDAFTPCDALTVSPYMGLDTLEPFFLAAEGAGRGVAVLVRTSNPGAADFQSLNTEGGEPLYHRVVQALAPAIERLKGAETGWSSLMLVVGATAPQEAESIRVIAPKALFLIPGYGAQGASAHQAISGFVTGPDGLEGGVVSASRSITMPPGAKEAVNALEWERLVSEVVMNTQNTFLSLCQG